ncbi:hypothetical protein AB0L65_11720 [Nonomuraea sp. NPDC052116]|uniref:hypothetical protein n=1 Tax=Nonomuraea sp. NPDC052116 TaxID=3155665 RepID=UPI00343F12D3
MKRVLAAAVAATALVTAAPAQAATPDPVKALKSQFVPGHGVKISELGRTVAKGKKPTALRVTGTFEFGASGVVASDVTIRGSFLKSSEKIVFRAVTVGKQSYIQSKDYEKTLPEGKTWLNIGEASRAESTFHPFNIFQPAQLKGLLSHAKSNTGSLYRGTLTAKQTNKLSGLYFGPSVDYRLSIGSSGLPSRLFTGAKNSSGGLDTVDTRYSDWGHKVTIKAPPEELVISSEELDQQALDELLQELRELQILPNEALASR